MNRFWLTLEKSFFCGKTYFLKVVGTKNLFFYRKPIFKNDFCRKNLFFEGGEYKKPIFLQFRNLLQRTQKLVKNTFPNLSQILNTKKYTLNQKFLSEKVPHVFLACRACGICLSMFRMRTCKHGKKAFGTYSPQAVQTLGDKTCKQQTLVLKEMLGLDWSGHFGNL